MSRLYSVTFESPDVPVTFNVVTVPLQGRPEFVTATEAVRELGLEINERFTVDSHQEAVARLSNLVALTLAKADRGTARSIEVALDARAADYHAFVGWVAEQKLIPVESSPLHGVSLGSLLKRGSLAGFAVVTEGFGLVHHDPVICVAAIPMVVVIGAALGAAEGLRERLRYLLGSERTKKKKKKKS